MTKVCNKLGYLQALGMSFFAISLVFSANCVAEETFEPHRQVSVEWNLKEIDTPNAAAKTEADMKEYTETLPGTEITFDMVPIKGGKFMMGSSEEEQEDMGGDAEDKYYYNPAAEGPQHEVEVAPFWMGKCEVTWDEYLSWSEQLSSKMRKQNEKVISENNKYADAIPHPTNAYVDMTFGMGKNGFPAICVPPFSAGMYCKWLTATTGRYYRLPTEAEWEYACRAGTDTAYSFGEDDSDIDDYAWYYDNVEEGYAKVGLKKPNPWGLYDMHGNVWEMCLDQYAVDSYQKLVDAAKGKTIKNPLVPANGAEYKVVVRGGSWDDDAERLRSAARWASHKDWKMQDPQLPQSIWYFTDAQTVGFRIVRPLVAPTAEEAKIYEPDAAILDKYKKERGNRQ